MPRSNDREGQPMGKREKAVLRTAGVLLAAWGVGIASTGNPLGAWMGIAGMTLIVAGWERRQR